MFLRTVMWGHSEYDWNTMPMLRLSGGRLVRVDASNTVAVAEADPALAGRLQARDAAQRRGLAAAAGPEQHEELAVGDVQVEMVDRGARRLPVEALDEPFQADVGHR